jgi:hypothetical protein
MHWLDDKQTQSSLLAPVAELGHSPKVSPPRVWVANVSGEKLDEAAAGVQAARRDQRRNWSVGFGEEYDWELVGITVHSLRS